MQKVIPVLFCLLALLMIGCGSGDSTDTETENPDGAGVVEPETKPEVVEPASFEEFLALYPDLIFPFDITASEMKDHLSNQESHLISANTRETYLKEAIEPHDDETDMVFSGYGKVQLKTEKWAVLTYHSYKGDWVVLSVFSPEGEWIASKNVFRTPDDQDANRMTVKFGKSVYGNLFLSKLTPTDFDSQGEPIAYMSATEDWKIYGNGTFGRKTK